MGWISRVTKDRCITKRFKTALENAKINDEVAEVASESNIDGILDHLGCIRYIS